MGFSWDDLLPIAGGVGGTIIGGPAGGAAGVAAGTLAKSAIDSASSNSPTASSVAPAQVDAGAFGPLPINVGAAPSAQTSDLTSQIAALQHQRTAARAAGVVANSGNTSGFQPINPNQSQIGALQAQEASIAQQMRDLQQDMLSNPFHATEKADQFSALASQLQTVQGQIASAQANPTGADAVDAQRNALQAQLDASQHADQLAGLTGAAAAATTRQAPQISSAPGTQLFNDLGNQQQDRQNQLAYGQMLTDAANGKGPSVAMDTLTAGRDASIRQAQSQANSVRGGEGNQALAARSAIYSGAQSTQDTARQAAILGAQEQQAARAQLGTALTGMRSGDATQNTTDAGIANNNATLQLGQNSQNDQANQYYMSLYFQALNGDRDAQIELQKLQSGNTNAANSTNAGISINNSDIGYKQGTDATRLGMSAAGGLATIAAAKQAQGPQSTPALPTSTASTPYDPSKDGWGF